MSNSSVKSADRVLDLLEAFVDAKRPLSLSDLADRLDAPVSSCHGLVHTLLQRGYLYGLGARKAVYPTRRLLDAARVIAAHDPVVERLRAGLLGLRDATGETVILGKRQGDAVVYLDVIEGLQTIRYTAAAGETKPLHSSAIGKAMLAQLDEAALPDELGRLALAQVTDATIVDAAALAEDISAARAKGVFITRGENVADVMAVAMDLDLGGECVGVAVAGPIHRMAEAEAAVTAALLGLKQDLMGGRAA